jgi:hypothetical protein
MLRLLRYTLPLALAVTGLSAHAQFYKLHNADVAVGGVGQFTTPLTSNEHSATGDNQQFTTNSAGVLVSLREHPVAWAGVELNYGYTRYQQRFAYYEPSSTDTFNVTIPNDVHEATAAYMFHPHFFHLQPFVNIGGGALDFVGDGASNQWRGAGLLETGFDIPTSNKHFGFRVQGRSLYYRAPNFYTSQISTKSWVVTEEPSVSAYIRF